jgi:predicted alpha-1,6-mannanase (GH76 family)
MQLCLAHAALLCVFLTAGESFVEHQAPVHVSEFNRSVAAATAAQVFYRPDATNNIYGLGWWQDAQAVEALSNLMIYANITTYLPIIESILRRDGGSLRIRLSGSYDDVGWWGLAYVRAYELTHNTQYLNSACTTFDHIAKAWDTACGGGVWWSAKKEYKNAITNELFLTLAMKLHLHNSSETNSTYYLDWARREWEWFKSSGMINEQNLVNDGLNGPAKDGSCVNNQGDTYTYNQGTLLSGLGMLYQATKQADALQQAEAIADATLSTLAYPTGVLKELCEDGTTCNHDGRQFKGIFIRHLDYLLQMGVCTDAKVAKYERAVAVNADSAWDHDRDSSGTFSYKWNGPFVPLRKEDKKYMHSADCVGALDLMNAAGRAAVVAVAKSN